jgi:hypothetical protein
MLKFTRPGRWNKQNLIEIMQEDQIYKEVLHNNFPDKPSTQLIKLELLNKAHHPDLRLN